MLSYYLFIRTLPPTLISRQKESIITTLRGRPFQKQVFS
jgi:hypothetical protein